MSSHPRLFDSSVAALSVLNPPPAKQSGVRPGMLSQKLGSGSTIAMSIQFAPEPEPTTNTVHLDEEQTTGPLALSFEFEFFGVKYTCFDLSADGFITFGTDSSLNSCNPARRNRFIPLNEDLSNFVAVGCVDWVPPGRRRIAYEVRGTGRRRRLVLSFNAIPGTSEVYGRGMLAQIILHERTGMIEVHTMRWNAGGSSGNETAIRFTTTPGNARVTA